MLAGRISNFWGRHAYLPATGGYATGSTPDPNGVAFSTLDELLTSWGLFAQDSWRMKPNFTLNMGLRWDFVSPDKDLTGKYHSMTPQDLYGPTGVGKLFKPGAQSLTGTFDPVYTAREAAYGHWNVTPQPAIGIAWTPRSDGSFIERLLGGDKSVLRASYSFRRFTMPQQFVWDMGSSFGIGFYQNFTSSPEHLGCPGNVHAGQHRARRRGLPAAVVRHDSLRSGRATCTAPQQYDEGHPHEGVDLRRGRGRGHQQRHPPALHPVLDAWAFSGTWAAAGASRFATTAIARGTSGSRWTSTRSTSSRTAS